MIASGVVWCTVSERWFVSDADRSHAVDNTQDNASG